MGKSKPAPVKRSDLNLKQKSKGKYWTKVRDVADYDVVKEMDKLMACLRRFPKIY